MIFKHFLNFLDLPSVGTIEISEPFGFDGSSFTVEQDSNRYGRDIYIFNETIELEFNREMFELLATPQQLINGLVINHASQGYDYILDVINNEGWNGRIEYIIEIDGQPFVTGIFDLFTAVIQDNSIKVKIIQDTTREKLKRNMDVVINAFADEDLEGNAITPCSTTDILLKAKPVFQESNWSYGLPEPKTFNLAPDSSFNFSNKVNSFGIENTLSFIQGAGLSDNFRYITAINQLTNVVVKLSNINVNQLALPGNVRLIWRLGFDIDDTTVNILQQIGSGQSFNSEFTINIPTIRRGEILWIYFRTVGNITRTKYTSMDVDISAISTSIDSVIKGVRLVDLIKHNIKATSTLDTIAPIYELGGEHYDNFAFNGYLLGQVTDKPFNNKFKDLMEILPEQNADYQVNPTNVEILPYDEFYQNNEIGAFIELPDHTSRSTYNKRYFINTAEIGFKSSAKGRETNGQNTIDEVHGKTQWKFPGKLSEGNLKLDFSHTRSAFLIEEQRRRVTDAQEGTSLQYDDNLFLLDCTQIAPSTKGGFGAVLLMNILDNGNLQVLNNNTDGDLGNFSWNLLGFGVGATFFIESGRNIGTYTVVSITPSILELVRVLGVTNFSGEAFIVVSYFYTNVLYINRRNEGFSFIDGIENKDDYSNLRYSFKRIIEKWYGYFATATKYDRVGNIKNTLFEVNGELITRLISESENVIDKGNIDVTTIADNKLLNPILHEISVFAEFAEILALVTDLQDDKGFVRAMLNSGKVIKGYPMKLDYEIVTNKLTMTLEEKFVSDYMTITSSDSILTVDGVVYNLSNFRLNDIWLQLFDARDIALNSPIRFTNVSINGVIYEDIDLFSEAMVNLL